MDSLGSSSFSKSLKEMMLLGERELDKKEGMYLANPGTRLSSIRIVQPLWHQYIPSSEYLSRKHSWCEKTTVGAKQQLQHGRRGAEGGGAAAGVGGVIDTGLGVKRPE